MALTSEQRFNCLGCSSNDRNVYVDDIMQTMINFLENATCIPWVRSNENIDRPDITETGEKMGQYGLIEILQSTRFKTDKPKLSSDLTVIENNENLDCYEIESTRDILLQLNIYREQGEANRDQESDDVVQPVGAGIDHLERLIDIFQFPRIKQALDTQGISLIEFSPIEWSKEIVKNIWENIGEMQITIRVCSRSSIADASIKCIFLQVCDHEPKEICEEFVPDC